MHPLLQFVAYSGYTSAGQTFYLDAFDQLGGSQYTLRPGYDCPETAAYMPVNMQGPYGQQYSYDEAVCFFENSGGDTTWRYRPQPPSCHHFNRDIPTSSFFYCQGT